ncbi:hypothetical protein POM88_048802 [Heracleum sosnowskyi]|uniref:Uncharacterized protein n=1 Tax=Heracleum sosnowskyi TaxID=360622 RepID=A0AAD8LZY9_9APIA|nr:hypothetical protein POM88_048802 [Heracleum sosnowskyi]
MDQCNGPSTASTSTSEIFARPKANFFSKSPTILLSLATSARGPIPKNVGNGFNHPCVSHYTLSHHKGGGGIKPLLPYIILSSFIKMCRVPSVILRFDTRKMTITNKDLVVDRFLLYYPQFLMCSFEEKSWYSLGAM